jgi:hypothetical protein
MQRMVLDWVIAEEGKRPKDFTDEERLSLRQLRKKLLRRGKPLPPGNYGSVEIVAYLPTERGG